MSYGSSAHLALLCAILPFPLGFQILFSVVLSTISTGDFRSLGQNLGHSESIAQKNALDTLYVVVFQDTADNSIRQQYCNYTPCDYNYL